jgi:hypothetical protein
MMEIARQTLMCTVLVTGSMVESKATCPGADSARKVFRFYKTSITAS